MSKVKHYVDSKQKTLHRQRRYETAHKKETRIRNSKLGVYYYWGYYHENEHYSYKYEKVEVPEQTCTNNKVDWDWYDQTGETVYISEKYVIPAHTAKRKVDTKVTPVSIVKRINKNAKDLKKIAARKLRRHVMDEDSPAAKGSLYKKNYDIRWELL